MLNRLHLALLVIPVAVAVACSAGGAKQADGAAGAAGTSGAGGNGGIAGDATLGLAGAAAGGQIDLGVAGAVATHPLFGAGNAAGVDLTDPCNTTQVWETGAALVPPVDHGSKVVFNGKLWELTGDPSDPNGSAYANPDCEPPGTGYCLTEYAWKELQDCPTP